MNDYWILLMIIETFQLTIDWAVTSNALRYSIVYLYIGYLRDRKQREEKKVSYASSFRCFMGIETEICDWGTTARQLDQEQRCETKKLFAKNDPREKKRKEKRKEKKWFFFLIFRCFWRKGPKARVSPPKGSALKHRARSKNRTSHRSVGETRRPESEIFTVSSR